MTPPEWWTAIAAGVATVGASVGATVAALTKKKNGHAKPVCPIDAANGLERLLDATHQQTDILGKIHDKLIGLDHRTDKSADAVVRVENSLQALHNRLDGTLPTRRT